MRDFTDSLNLLRPRKSKKLDAFRARLGYHATIAGDQRTVLAEANTQTEPLGEA